MKDYHEDIAIYSRFLKNDNIYENNNVALEHLHYFSDINPENITKYAKIAIQEDNIVYDYIIVSYIDDEEVENKIIEDLKKKIENEIASLKNTLSEDEIVCFSGNFAIMEGVVSEDTGSRYNYSNFFADNKEMFFCMYNPDIYKMTKKYYDEVFYKYIENNYDAYFDSYGSGLYRNLIYDEDMQWNQYNNCYYRDYNLVNEETICYSMNGEYLNLKVNDDIFAYFLKEEYTLEDLYREILKNYIIREQLEVTQEELEQLYEKLIINSWIYYNRSNIELRIENENGWLSEYVGEVSVFSGNIPYFEYGDYRIYV